MNGVIFQDVPDDLNEGWLHGSLWGGMASIMENLEMAKSFRAAAEVLTKRNKVDFEAYEVVNPILFLYRHALELYLKAIVLRIQKGNGLQKYNHDLNRLFETILQYADKERLIIPQQAHEIIKEFAKIDNKSSSFKYGEGFKPGEYWIDFYRVKRRMSWLLDGFQQLYDKVGK